VAFRVQLGGQGACKELLQQIRGLVLVMPGHFLEGGLRNHNE
jgi:hypothetical protein